MTCVGRTVCLGTELRGDRVAWTEMHWGRTELRGEDRAAWGGQGFMGRTGLREKDRAAWGGLHAEDSLRLKTIVSVCVRISWSSPWSESLLLVSPSTTGASPISAVFFSCAASTPLAARAA